MDDINQTSRTMKQSRQGMLASIAAALSGVAGFVAAIAGLDRVAQIILVSTACLCSLLAFRKFVLVRRYRREDAEKGKR